MIETFNPINTRLTFYVLLNVFFCIVTACWIVGIFITRRYLLVKPSMLLLTFSHIFFQCPFTVYAGYYENFLPDPYACALLIHTYMIMGLLVSVFTFHRSAGTVWDRITNPRTLKNTVSERAVLFTVSLVACVVSAYLAYVPFTSTGLYAIFVNPSIAAEAREKSLKLLDSRVLQYAYSLMVSSLAPLLSVLLGFLLLQKFRRREFLKLFTYSIVLFFLIFSVSMTGARISAVNLLLVIAIAFVFSRGIPFKPIKFVALIFILLLPPTLLSILREGKIIGLGTVFEYLGYLAQRAFVMPLDTASLYVHYAQSNSFWGISAIPKLAAILGIPSINAPNLIGLAYTSTTVESTSAGAGYLFTYYSYFGLASILLSILGLWVLDIALLVYERLGPVMILPCVSAASLAILAFISSDYTVVWLTHGFGVTLLLSWLIDRWIVSSGADPRARKASSV